MFHSVSVSGMFKNDCFKVETTLMYPEELHPLLARYNAYSVTITSKDEDRPVKAEDFNFYLLCNGQFIQPARLSDDEESIIERYHKKVDGIETNLLLFPKSHDIHILITQFLLYHCPTDTFAIFRLKF